MSLLKYTILYCQYTALFLSKLPSNTIVSLAAQSIRVQIVVAGGGKGV